MATTPTTARPGAKTPPKSTATAYLALLLGWLVPGAGHLLLGKWVRALLLFVSITAMFVIGVALAGQIYQPNTGDMLDMLGFAGQLGMGVLYAIARIFSLGAPSVVDALGDYGTKFLIAAGLLNIIAAVDAHSLANGRKAGL